MSHHSSRSHSKPRCNRYASASRKHSTPSEFRWSSCAGGTTFGARAALQQARALLSDASERLMYSVGSADRRRTGALVADLASLVGWQSLDAGDGHEAWRSFEQAKAAAREAGDAALLAHAMGEQSIALLDVGRACDAAALINEARSQVGLPPRLSSWLFAAQAEVFACAGDRIGAAVSAQCRTYVASTRRRGVDPVFEIGQGEPRPLARSHPHPASRLRRRP